jgi:hypothetical protein
MAAAAPHRTLDDLPVRFAHGRNARYVRGCRCDLCRTANRNAQRRRAAHAKAAAAEISLAPAPPARGRTGRLYRRMCPGPPDGGGCKRGAHLKSNSIGGLCWGCRQQLVWNGIVDAGPTRRHLRKLGRKQIGYKRVAAVAGVGKTILQQIRRGKRKRCRKETERRVLAVGAGDVADGGWVAAGPTLRKLGDLVRVFGSKAAVARELGYKTPALQIAPRGAATVRGFNARRVAALHAEWCGGGSDA